MCEEQKARAGQSDEVGMAECVGIMCKYCCFCSFAIVDNILKTPRDVYRTYEAVIILETEMEA